MLRKRKGREKSEREAGGRGGEREDERESAEN